MTDDRSLVSDKSHQDSEKSYSDRCNQPFPAQCAHASRRCGLPRRRTSYGPCGAAFHNEEEPSVAPETPSGADPPPPRRGSRIRVDNHGTQHASCRRSHAARSDHPSGLSPSSQTSRRRQLCSAILFRPETASKRRPEGRRIFPPTRESAARPIERGQRQIVLISDGFRDPSRLPKSGPNKSKMPKEVNHEFPRECANGRSRQEVAGQ